MTEVEEKVLEEMRELIRENDKLRERNIRLESELERRDKLIEWLEEKNG